MHEILASFFGSNGIPFCNDVYVYQSNVGNCLLLVYYGSVHTLYRIKAHITHFWIIFCSYTSFSQLCTKR